MSARRESSLAVVAGLGDVLRAGPTPTIAQVFGHGARVTETSLERDLGPVAPFVEAGLLGRVGDGAVEATLTFGTYRGLIIGSDRRDRKYRADHVLGITWATEVAWSLTPRSGVRLALDVGTGNGVHALGLAANATEVVAVDVSSRALAATRLNAALNGISNVRVVRSDLLAQVKDERFDVIVANPPYVISPDHHFLYRDSGLPDDEVSRRCVVDAGRALAVGGVAVVLVEWLDGPTRTWTRPKRWVAEAGCGGWVMSYRTMSVPDYIDTWISVPHRRPDEAATRERWREMFRGSGAESVTSGVVILRKSGTPDPWVHGTDFAPRPGSNAWPQVRRGLDWQEAIQTSGAGSVRTDRLRLAEDVKVGDGFLQTPLGAIRLTASEREFVGRVSIGRRGRRLKGGSAESDARLLRLLRAGAFA